MTSLKSILSSTLLAIVAASAPGLTSAAPITFFGTDPLAAGTVPAGGSSVTARNAFAAGLLSSRTENFEAASFVAGSQPTAANPQAILGGAGTMFRNTGALGDTRIENRTTIGGVNTGRFNTSSAAAGQWWETSASFTLTLNSAAQAIGFFGTDFGDFAGSLVLNLFNGDEAVTGNILVPPGGGQNGSLLFFGYANSDISFDRVVFTVGQQTPGNTNSYDFVGLDDLIVGAVNGGTPPPPPPPGVPEPGTMALAALSLGLLAILRRRRQ